METQLQTFGVYLFSQLAIGDRFYFVGDSKKTVWEVASREGKNTSYRSYAGLCKRSEYGNPIVITKNVESQRQVVFLRNQIKP